MLPGDRSPPAGGVHMKRACGFDLRILLLRGGARAHPGRRWRLLFSAAGRGGGGSLANLKGYGGFHNLRAFCLRLVRAFEYLNSGRDLLQRSRQGSPLSSRRRAGALAQHPSMTRPPRARVVRPCILSSTRQTKQISPLPHPSHVARTVTAPTYPSAPRQNARSPARLSPAQNGTAARPLSPPSPAAGAPSSEARAHPASHRSLTPAPRPQPISSSRRARRRLSRSRPPARCRLAAATTTDEAPKAKGSPAPRPRPPASSRRYPRDARAGPDGLHGRGFCARPPPATPLRPRRRHPLSSGPRCEARA